jgi:hypothetical protein
MSTKIQNEIILTLPKYANFRVLQFYPLKIPRDSEDGDQRDVDTLSLDLLHFLE